MPDPSKNAVVVRLFDYDLTLNKPFSNGRTKLHSFRYYEIGASKRLAVVTHARQGTKLRTLNTGAREQNRTADLLITKNLALTAVLSHETPALAGDSNERCAQSYLLWQPVTSSDPLERPNASINY